MCHDVSLQALTRPRDRVNLTLDTRLVLCRSSGGLYRADRGRTHGLSLLGGPARLTLPTGLVPGVVVRRESGEDELVARSSHAVGRGCTERPLRLAGLRRSVPHLSGGGDGWPRVECAGCPLDGNGKYKRDPCGQVKRDPCSASTTFAGRVASYEDVTRLPQEDRTDGLRLGAAELPDVEVMLSPCRPGIGGRLRGAAVKAVSPAERGQSEAMRLDGGEHRRRLA